MDDRHARHRRPDADRRRRPTDGFRTSSAGRFERLADDAVAQLPRELLEQIGKVVVSVREVPTGSNDAEAPPRLAIYEPPNDTDAAAGSPGRIVVHRRPLEARAMSRRDLFELIREAVADELADHLGLDGDGFDGPRWA